MGVPRYTGKELTKYLRTLAMEAESIADDGTPITRAEALARALWTKALGGKKRNRDGTESELLPEAWAIQLIYERLEGKVANAATDESGKITTAEKVSELSRNRINSLSTVATGTKKSLPPKIPKKEQDSGNP